MKLLPLTAIIVLLLTNAAVADDSPEIKEIRNYYTGLSKETIRCVLNAESGDWLQSDRCKLYVKEVSDNNLNLQIPVVGTYKLVTEYWKDRSGSFDSSGSDIEPWKDGEDRLVLVKVNGQSAAYEWYEEYLYRQGEPTFYLLKSDFGEYRFYFKEGELLRFTETGRPKELDNQSPYVRSSDDWPVILKEAVNHQQYSAGSPASLQNSPGISGDRLSDYSVSLPTLCDDKSPPTTPEDLRIPDDRLTIERAIESVAELDKLLIEIGSYDPKADAKECVHPDCIAGVYWEVLNMGAPNQLRTIKGTLLKLDLAYQAEKFKNAPNEEASLEFEAAKNRFCEFISDTPVVD